MDLGEEYGESGQENHEPVAMIPNAVVTEITSRSAPFVGRASFDLDAPTNQAGERVAAAYIVGRPPSKEEADAHDGRNGHDC